MGTHRAKLSDQDAERALLDQRRRKVGTDHAEDQREYVVRMHAQIASPRAAADGGVVDHRVGEHVGAREQIEQLRRKDAAIPAEGAHWQHEPLLGEEHDVLLTRELASNGSGALLMQPGRQPAAEEAGRHVQAHDVEEKDGV